MRFTTLLLICLFSLWSSQLAGCATVTAVGATEQGAGAEAMGAMSRWVESGADIATAASWSRKVKAGVTVDEIREAFASVAAEDNLRPVGELFVSGEVAVRTGKPARYLKIYSYCDPATARLLVDFSPAMSAFLPCRISVVEQDDGLWIYSINMDLIIKMGKRMPPDVHESVLRVRQSILKMLERGASGEF